jgi:4a-hydroxytetrahydrobiopterin dehydratase
MTKLPYPQVAAALPPGWVLLLDRIAIRIPTRDFATGLALVDQIGAAAEAANHHPDLDLRYSAVEVRLPLDRAPAAGASGLLTERPWQERQVS